MTSKSQSSNERVRTLVELASGPRVLHVGCCNNRRPQSSAEWEDWAHEALVRGGLDVLGCDIDDDGLEWMRGQGYEVVHLDAEALEADERFDSVVAGELIEHLENPGLFLAGCRRVLKPDGRLVLSTPNPFAVLHAAIFLKDGRARPFHPEHTGWFCAQTLGQRLERAGFRVERTLYVDDLRPGAGNVGGLYRLFARVWGKVRRFAPERYRNTLVVVATPAA